MNVGVHGARLFRFLRDVCRKDEAIQIQYSAELVLSNTKARILVIPAVPGGTQLIQLALIDQTDLQFDMRVSTIQIAHAHCTV